MSDVGSTLVGGGLTLVGGFGGVMLTRYLSDRREDARAKKEVLGAINTVLWELSYNAKVLEQAANHGLGEVPVVFTAYRKVELILHQTLSESTLDALHGAYGPLEASEQYEAAYSLGRPFGASTLEPTSIRVDTDQCSNLARLATMAAAALKGERDRL
jgi:hypothetical protein